ncbi:hypothetical protein Lal_00003371 [Lupinus albus]|nr:hypothetical protein Lal_00003371 [Lupinus albus]
MQNIAPAPPTSGDSEKQGQDWKMACILVVESCFLFNCVFVKNFAASCDELEYRGVTFIL